MLHDAIPQGVLEPGQRLGPLVLGEPLGQGGMGAVFAAYDERLEREVAVKVLLHRDEEDGEDRRLLAEARALSQLDHPNIARVFDYVEGELTYITLEKIDGETLAERLKRGPVPRAEGLRIAHQIADAMAAAHAAGILHRDLKPSNIILSTEGRAKVVDFGLAYQNSRDQTVFGTPAFMSPEQARGERLSTSTDLYSLGLLLQQLFTGESPYGEYADSPQLLAMVVEGETLPMVDPDGDLTLLIERLKARAPAARPSATDVLDRLRWIRDRPRRRRRWMFAAGVALALVAGATKYTLDLRHERNLAVAAQQESEAISGFLVDLFQAPDPYASAAARRDGEVTAASILDRGVEQIGADLAEQPGVRASLLSTMAHAYRGLGEFDKARSLYGEALRIRRETPGGEDPRLADALSAMAKAEEDVQNFEQAERLHREALALRIQRLGEEHLDVADSLLGLGEVLASRNLKAEAGQYLERALALRRQQLGPLHPSVLQAQHELGVHYRNQRQYTRAEALFRETIGGMTATVAADDPNLATAWLNLATTVRDAGRWLEAEPLARQALERMRAALGAEHPWVGASEALLGSVLLWTGHYGEAEAIYQEAAQRSVRQAETLGEASSLAAIHYLDLGMFYRQAGRVEEAEPWLERAVIDLEQSVGVANVRTLSALRWLAHLRLDQGRTADAVVLYRRVLEASESLEGGRDTSLGSAYLLGADLALAQGDAASALAQAEASLAKLVRRYKAGHWRLAEAESTAGAALCALGEGEEGARRARGAYEDLLRALGPDSRWTTDALRAVEGCAPRNLPDS